MGVDSGTSGRLWADLPLSFPSIPLSYAVGCGVFCWLSKLAMPYLVPSYSKLHPKTRLEWGSRVVAMAHSAIMFILTVHYWLSVFGGVGGFSLEKMQLDNLPGTLTENEALVIDLMIGYLMYDTIAELVTTARISPDILAHHGVGLTSHLLTRLMNSGPAGLYTMIVYLAEGSTPFLHLGWFMYNLHMQTHKRYNWNAATIMVMFFLLRIVLAPFALWHMWVWRASWENHGGKAVWLMQFSIVWFFCLLNYWWYYKLIKMVSRQVKGAFHNDPNIVQHKSE